MKYTRIPGTDLSVSVICLGGQPLGSALSREQSFELLDRYVSHGGNFVDTARVYSDWLPGERSSSEKMIGRWLAERRCRDGMVVTTKGAHAAEEKPGRRLAREDIMLDLDKSLVNLGVDTIDFYWLHRDDEDRPVADILGTLEEAVAAGKIRYYGCSNWQERRIVEAAAHSAAGGMRGFVGNQMMWSVAAIDKAKLPDPGLAAMDASMYAMHARTGLAAIPYSAQAQGLFSKIDRGAVRESEGSHFLGLYPVAPNMEIYGELKRLAGEAGVSVSRIALAYMLSLPFTTIPIAGCHTVAQLDDSMLAADLRLDAGAVARLARAQGNSAAC